MSSNRIAIIGSRLSRLLDVYPGARAAYSVYLLRSAYAGSCLRVRRSSDGVEQDIGFTASGLLDTAALLTFIGANDGTVATWYDQSGNGDNTTQAVAANQIRIVSAGVLDTEGGIAALQCLSSTDARWLNFTGTGLDIARNVSYMQGFFVVRPSQTDAGAKPIISFANNSANQVRWGHQNAFGGNPNRMTILARRLDNVGAASLVSNTDHNGDHLQTTAMVNYNDAEAYLYQDGSLVDSSASFLTAGATSNTASVNGHIGRQTGTTPLYWAGSIQEVVLWNADQTANRAAIEAHQMTRFGL